MSFSLQQERLYDLLADRALVGLDPNEEHELAQLLVQFPDADRIGRELEDAATSIAIAGVVNGYEAMPQRLLMAVEQAAEHSLPTTVHFAPFTAFADAPPEPTRMMPERPLPPMPVQPPVPPQQPYASLPPTDPRMRAQSNVVPFAPRERTPSRAPLIAGWVAAAACLLLAVGAYFLKSRPQVIVQNPLVTPSVSTAPPNLPPPVLSPKEEREKLLAQAGTAKLDWSKTKDPASKETSGDVIWNASVQKGFMRFRGLAKNDPKATQYQLWIFDKSRDDKYPVDGGVFDVDEATGDVIVPIKAKLPVNEIALFAVTVEKPGGVVVSKRERIVVTAKPAT